MEQYRVAPGLPVTLAAIDPDDRSGFDGDKASGAEELERLTERLVELQQLLYADARHKVLVVLQATDTGGKDGTIRHVFHGVNPQGVRVASFKRPTDVERSHDFLWRIHRCTPHDGQLTIFNRSHYEDVLVVRVHDLVPEARWKQRYEHIRSFEKLLVDEGTTIVKFFLHISRDEQRKRLLSRLDDPTKRWKFEKGDLDERKHWDDYQAAFEEAIEQTTMPWAPWYVIPSNRKWYRNVAVATVLVNLLESLDLRYPDAPDLANVVVPP